MSLFRFDLFWLRGAHDIGIALLPYLLAVLAGMSIMGGLCWSRKRTIRKQLIRARIEALR